MRQDLNSEENVTLDDIIEMSEEELNELIGDMSPDPPTLDDIIRQRDYVAQRNRHQEGRLATALSFVSIFLVLSIYMAEENEWSLVTSNWILGVALLILLSIVFISNVVARRLRSWIPWIKN